MDKLELRVPRRAFFTAPITALLRRIDLIRPGQHYRSVLDLRPHGFDALLHYGKRRGEPNHKLELFETGKKPFSELVGLIEGIVDGNAGRLELMRLDLCADVSDVPVSWFRDHLRVRYKQRERRLGPLTTDLILRTEVETITFGARPNVIRIYNKIEEELARFKRARRKQSRDADQLDFMTEYGHSPHATLTRIERQYGGGRLPETVRTFGTIGSVASIDPFETIELETNVWPLPNERLYDCREWLIGVGLRNEAQTRGAHNLRRWLNQRSHGNAARMMKRYAPFLPHAGSHTLSKADLLSIFRQSVIRQLAA